MNKFFINILLSAMMFLVLSLHSCIDDDINQNSNLLNFNDSWLFIQPDSSNIIDVERVLISGETLSGTVRLTLPHTTELSENNEGACYYFRKFYIPEYLRGRRLSLFFEGIDGAALVCVNGKYKQTVSNSFEPFVVDFKPMTGENFVFVKLERMGALYSNVWLRAQDSICFTHVAENLSRERGIVITPFDIKDGNGNVNIRAVVRNSHKDSRKVKFEYRILDHNKRVLAKGHVSKIIMGDDFLIFDEQLAVNNITLWDIDNPWLYTLDARVISDDVVVDQQFINFGFRTIEVTPGSIRINGKDRFLMGVNVEHEYPFVGRALTKCAHFRDAFKVKRAGFDFVNVSNIHHPKYFLDACDQYGIIVLDTCNENRDLVVRNHPSVVYVPNSKGVKQYGQGMIANINDKENVLVDQARIIAQNHSMNRMSNHFADAYISMFDNNCNDGIGVMDCCRNPKFSYYFLQSQRDIDEDELKAFAEPVCNIQTKWIPFESRGVWVCTNCDYVELIVDGVSQGKKKAESSEYNNSLKHPSAFFDVACTKPGEIKAIAFSNYDEPLAECTVRTPGKPVRVKLVIDESGNLIESNDIVFVHCYILDNNGTIVSTSSDEVEFSVSGTAQLLSPSKVKAQSGIASCLIRTGKSNSDFTISAKCGMMYTVADK